MNTKVKQFFFDYQDNQIAQQELKTQLAELNAQMKDLYNAENILKERMFNEVNKTEDKLINIGAAKLSISSGKSSVKVTSVELLPKKYQRIKVEPNLIAIKKDVAAGKTILGVRKTVGTPYLVIR